MNNILSAEQIRALKTGGKILAQALDEVEKKIRPGISTAEIDQIAEEALTSRGARPAFKNYNVGSNIYPFAACVSVNEQIVHGLPSAKRILRDGDIVSVDLGAEYHGVNTDMAKTYPVGTVDPKVLNLLKITEQSLYAGIDAAKAGKRIGSIGNAVEQIANRAGYGIVRELVGHGIGSKVHMAPNIPNYGSPSEGAKMVPGMALAIEPMLTLGSPDIKVENDGWTISTADSSPSAHFEHTIIIENDEAVIVTRI